MPLVTGFDLPEFDYFDPKLKGSRLHETLKDLQRLSWLARLGFG